MTNNKNVLNWIEEMKALVKPDKVVWIDGSEERGFFRAISFSKPAHSSAGSSVS